MKVQHPRIGGTSLPGSAGVREITSPYDGAVVGKVSYASAEQMADAIEAASEAFKDFRLWPSYKRSEILRKTSLAIQERREEIAKLISLESGKPISYARTEADRAAFTFASAAAEAMHAGDGEIIDMTSAPNGEGRIGSFRYFPLGVIAGITPFNFPLNLVAHKVAPAIASGNALVLKPAPQTPLSSFLLYEILESAGLPPGVLSVVSCENEVAESLVTDPRIKLISFTGSDKVGWSIKAKSGMARTTLELGGNGAVILNDTENLDAVISSLATAAFLYAGQICISLQHLYVHHSLYPEVKERIVNAARMATVGDPLDDKTVVGPMISAAAAEEVEGWIAEAVATGAKRLTGEFRKPNSITSTVLEDVPEEAKISREEAFAPVVILHAYDDFSSVLQQMNRSKFGLQAGLFTTDQRLIDQAYQELEVGGLIVNDTNAFRLDTMPYGGVKSSGLGREGIRYAMRDMMEMKLLVSRSKY